MWDYNASYQRGDLGFKKISEQVWAPRSNRNTHKAVLSSLQSSPSSFLHPFLSSTRCCWTSIRDGCNSSGLDILEGLRQKKRCCPCPFGKKTWVDKAPNSKDLGLIPTPVLSLRSKANVTSHPHSSGPQFVICKIRASDWMISEE